MTTSKTSKPNGLSTQPKTVCNQGLIRDGHDNFFTPLRLFFAALVLIGHSFVVSLRDLNAEPQVFFEFTFSYLAVNMFFLTSGFLVTKSIIERPNKTTFISARVLRIMPALVALVLFTMFIVGPLMTSQPLKTFFTSPDWYLQPFKVLSFINTDMALPGMFPNNAEHQAGAPLWTLRYEVIAYIGTFIAFSLGAMRERWMVLTQFVAACIGLIAFAHFNLADTLPATISQLLRFAVPYSLGAVIYVYRDQIKCRFGAFALMLLLAYIVGEGPVLEILTNGLLAWLVFRLAYLRAPRLDFLKRVPDMSYGVYIYHWLVLQVLFDQFPNLSVSNLFYAAILPTFMLAALSWYLVEKPALKHKKTFAAWIKSHNISTRQTQSRRAKPKVKKPLEF